MLVLKDKILAIDVSNSAPVTGTDSVRSSKPVYAGSNPVRGAILALLISLSGCVTIQHDNSPEGFATFQVSDKSQVSFFCHHIVDNRGDHIHCSKWILQY